MAVIVPEPLALSKIEPELLTYLSRLGMHGAITMRERILVRLAQEIGIKHALNSTNTIKDANT